MGGKRKSLSKKKPDVSKELEGLNITINTFGEIQSTYDIEKINTFLDAHVKDKKLQNQMSGQSQNKDCHK
jgi:hypothetical protein